MTDRIPAEAMFPDGALRFRPANRQPTGREIVAEVASRNGLTFAELIGPRRYATVALARQEAMWELRQRTKLSFPQIGHLLGGRDHTTILYGVRRYQRRLAAG